MKGNSKRLKRRFSAAILLTCLTLAGNFSLAQTSISFRVRVYDSLTKQALQYTTVSIPQKGIGSITNQYGECTLYIPSEFKDDKIQLSFIGYKTQEIKISSIIPDSIYSFQLESFETKLEEASIVAGRILPASKMVEKAIRNIPGNYSKNPFLLHAFYRDYTRKIETEDYNNLIEAAVLIHDHGFRTNNFINTELKLEQLRLHPSFSTDSTLSIGYSPNRKIIPYIPYYHDNELIILLGQDPVRNSVKVDESFLPIFDMDFIRDYFFQYEACIETDSLNIYVIDFSAVTKDIKVKDKPVFRINGKLYVEDDSYALLKLYYRVDCELSNYEGKFLEVKIEYKKQKQDYYLNYLTACNYFELNINSDSSHIISPERTQHFQYRELFVNQIEKRPFKNSENYIDIQKYNPLFSESIITQNGFWEQYNYPLNTKLLD